MTDDVHAAICLAIRDCKLLELEYSGLRRVVAPYCHGFTDNGEALRAIQVRGESGSGGFGFGKLWLVQRMRYLRCTDEHFTPNDPHYNPLDTAMKSIHCAVAVPTPSRHR
jgi:hypothetical protein